MPLPHDDQLKLIKLLGMLGSDADGECLNAARAAQRLVKASGLTWEQAMIGTDDAAKRAFSDGYRQGRASARPPTWRDLCRELLDDCSEDLTEWETEFVESYLERGWPSPTTKQQAVFERIAEKCGVETPA